MFMKRVFWGLRLLGGFHALRAGLVTMLAESVARPARYIIWFIVPHAARRSGRWRGVKHSFALRAMSLRDDVAR